MEENVRFELASGESAVFNTEKGTIENAELSRPVDRPFLTIYIGVNFGGSFQGAFGGIVLGGVDEKDAETSATTLDIIRRITELFSVENLGDIVGKKVTVIRRGHNDNIIGLQSEDGYTFFIDHWRIDNFPELGENLKKMEANNPIRNERGSTHSNIGKRNRLEDVE